MQQVFESISLGITGEKQLKKVDLVSILDDKKDKRTTRPKTTNEAGGFTYDSSHNSEVIQV